MNVQKNNMVQPLLRYRRPQICFIRLSVEKVISDVAFDMGIVRYRQNSLCICVGYYRI